MNEDVCINESLRQKILELLNKTFDYDGATHLLAVAIRKVADGAFTEETILRLRVAMTYREGKSINPYWDGTEIDIILKGEHPYLLNEQTLADEPPMIEGSPNELALEWVSALATPLWISNEVKEAALEELELLKAMEVTQLKSTEDPFEQ
ncbi:hypothetical protein [Paenibacillus sp. HW567]|uniref:hypothetical protein n=1 Tax=Paenibacillus sp. HW567 TaxID=1034769 RepID=UPI0003612E69|nr:hypothetical protein [Paenibacillus sp. HW567]